MDTGNQVVQRQIPTIHHKISTKLAPNSLATLQLATRSGNYTFPLNPSKLSMPSKIIVVHPIEYAVRPIIAPPITCSPRTMEAVAHHVKVDSKASYCAQTLKDCTKDTGSGEKDSTNPSKHGENELACASLRSFPTHERNEYSSRVREGDSGITELMQHPAVSGSSVSFPPSSQMRHLHEEQGENCSASRQAQDENTTDFEAQASFNNGGRVWDILQDNETLREHYRIRKNLVLDSVCPDWAPHIIITPAEETWNDQLVAWENRVGPQWMGSLMIPIINTTWLPPPPPPEPSSESVIHLERAPSIEGCTSYPVAVFSASKFNKLIESASIERLVMCQLIRTLQKQRCRAAFFDASTIAQSFRERYDASLDCFKSLEPPFMWCDPAEPTLVISTKLLGTTIIDSPCPFLAPHIIINAPPPQDFWISWNNATNDPQDQGFGQYLVVPSAAVRVVNTAEDSGWESASSAYFDQAVDQSESPTTPDTPLPETPVDERDDLDYFLTRHGDDADAGIDTAFYYQSFCGLLPIQEEYLEGENTKSPSRAIFSIEEDEDDLPPFDDWYQ